jgi:hypothetical protein
MVAKRKSSKRSTSSKRKTAGRATASRKSARRKSASRKAATPKSATRKSAKKSATLKPAARARKVAGVVKDKARQGLEVAKHGLERLKSSTAHLVGDVKQRIGGEEEPGTAAG